MFELKSTSRPLQRALLVGIYSDREPKDEAESLLKELNELVDTLGIPITDSLLVKLNKPQSRYFLGSGKSEEVVRLATHLGHFQEIMKEDESPGRKLEFLTQEMFRETNTIGSKASDVEISRQVVEIKGTLEKIRELIQNVE